MNLIVNVSADWAIGKNNKLLFHFSEDMKFFKRMTTNKVIVMGRKTLESLPGGKPLPNRINIVLTRNDNFDRGDVIVCHSTDELYDILNKYNSEDIFIIGGQSIYSLMLDKCDTAYVTKVESPSPDDADAFMVDLDSSNDWFVSEISEAHEEKGHIFKFITYKHK